jgi:hypothetical protein
MQVPKLKQATTGARECLIDVVGTTQAFIHATIGGVVGMKRVDPVKARPEPGS